MSRESATRTLTHYVGTLWRQAGFGWDTDHAAEIESIVEFIADAAVAEANAHADRRIARLETLIAEFSSVSASLAKALVDHATEMAGLVDIVRAQQDRIAELERRT
jgi:uncharacterized coiled-coil protein SlyX